MAYSGKFNYMVLHSFIFHRPYVAWRHFWRRRSFFLGLELSFYSGVYGTCIGATRQFGESSKALIGISGIVLGFGEIVGKQTLKQKQKIGKMYN